MDKLKMQSLDVIGSNIQKIAQLFPNCVTEHFGKDGKTELGIDFEKLQAELSNDIIAEGAERYQFTWPGKRAAIRLANTPTTMTLRPCREESVDFDNTQNLYIEGDNLDVLKVLRETYLGKVKMIYIDPPYNTGNDFVYNDTRKEDLYSFEGHNGLYDDDGNMTMQVYERNTESNGRFHTDWLNMIYPRLKVARDLLTDDGVIFISIDDNEVENLRKICNEVFGESNNLGCYIKQSKVGGGSDSRFIVKEHEYCLVYAKAILSTEEMFIAFDEEYLTRYKEQDEKGRYFWDTFARPGLQLKAEETMCYSIQYPDGTYSPVTRWIHSKERFLEEYESGMIRIKPKDNGWSVQIKQYLNSNGKKPRSMTMDFGGSAQSKIEIKSLFENDKVFSYPKSIKFILTLINTVKDNDAIILDFFSGSATTAHAVMKLNAEDGGNRKFIMVQLPELTDEKSEAYKAGYKNICEIGKERIRRAGRKIKEELGVRNEELGIKLDVGFRVLKLDTSNMEDVYYTPQEFELQSLFNENVKADRTNEDLLFQVMLDLGIELSAKIESKQIAGKNVHFVDDNYLVACFDRDLNESTITEIAKLQPIYFVMRDASAANDNVIDNFEQIFRHYSPDTVCKII